MAGKRRRRGVHMPHDIVEEILVKAPVKSLLRFKAVSKEWRRSIESTCFIEKHISYQRSLEGRGQGSILSVSGKSRRDYRFFENLLVTPCSGGGGGGSCTTQTYPSLHVKAFRPTNNDLEISEPCDGLFCFYSKTRDLRIHLVNPATNSRRILPDHISTTALGESGCSLLGIGRENAAVACPKYKLLCVLVEESVTKCKVFALGSNNWRYVDPPKCQVYCDHHQPIIHLDGVLYCFGFHGGYQPCISINLQAFDLHTETFRSFPVTRDLGSRDCRELRMCVLYHRPCIFKESLGCINDLVFKIWGLDINKSSWEVMSSIDFACLPLAFGDKIITPVATINNYVVLSNRNHHMWLLDGSKIHYLRHTFAASSKKIMSFFETLVSVY